MSLTIVDQVCECLGKELSNLNAAFVVDRYRLEKSRDRTIIVGQDGEVSVYLVIVGADILFEWFRRHRCPHGGGGGYLWQMGRKGDFFDTSVEQQQQQH